MILHDTFTMDRVRRTSDGYVAAFAKVARTGIQEYQGHELGRPDLGTVRVYRPPEEVFAPDALKSFAHRPVTLKHPSVPVTAKNWKRFAGGQTGGEVVRDGEFVRVPMVMMDQKLIDAYEKRGVKELSMGYSTDIQWRTGVVDAGQPDAGQRYDAVQTAIRGNHLAVVPLARGGEQLRIGDSKKKKKLNDNDFRKLIERIQDWDGDDDDDDEDDVDPNANLNPDDDYVDDAWSDEARQAALAARQSNAKNTPAGAKDTNGRYIVPGGQGQDKEGAADHQLHRTILNAGYKYSHSTPIHKLNGDTVMHHTYEKGEHYSNPGASVMDTHKVSVSHGSDKWTTSTGGGSGRQTTGEGESSLSKHLASKASRYKELRQTKDSSSTQMTDAWSDEARQAAIEARRAQAHHFAMSDIHSVHQDDDEASPKDTTEHAVASGQHLRAAMRYSKAIKSYKNDDVHGGNAEKEKAARLGKTADNQSKKLGVNENDVNNPHSPDREYGRQIHKFNSQTKDSSSSDDVDYTACPECGADIPPGSSDCPECGYHMTTNDGASYMTKIVIDGVPVNVADEQTAAIIDRHVSKLERKLKDAKADCDTMTEGSKKKDQDLEDAQKTISAKDGEIAVLKKQVEDAVITPAKLDVMVKDRLVVIDAASTLLDKTFTFDGKSIEVIRRAAVEANLGDAAKTMDDAAIGGAFAALTADAKKQGGGSQPIRQALFTGGRNTQVGDSRTAAYDEKIKRQSEAWRNKATA